MGTAPARGVQKLVAGGCETFQVGEVLAVGALVHRRVQLEGDLISAGRDS